MNKYTIEIDENSIKRKLEYEGITFEDEMIEVRGGCWSTINEGIECMLDEAIEKGEIGMPDELYEAIDNNDFTEILSLLND